MSDNKYLISGAYRALYESAVRVHEAVENHRIAIEAAGPDPITGKWHTQACWAGGLRWGRSDLSGDECWCGLHTRPEVPTEMRDELYALLKERVPRPGVVEEFLARWGVR